MKKSMMRLTVLALSICPVSHAADGNRYQKEVAKMTCGGATYTLSSTCIKSGDLMTLNECKPQTLVVETAGGKRSTTLPELSSKDAARIRTVGGNMADLFVVAWACTSAGGGPIATFHYSIGGGSAEDSEAWSHYEKEGNLVSKVKKLGPDQARGIQRNFMAVPSIMPR